MKQKFYIPGHDKKPQYDIVGESYHYDELTRAYKNRLKPHLRVDINENVEATIETEPDNDYDENAIAVKIKGETAGYIASGKAVELSPLIAAIEARGCVAVTNAQVYLWSQGKKIVGGGIKIGLKPKELKEVVASGELEAPLQLRKYSDEEKRSHDIKFGPIPAIVDRSHILSSDSAPKVSAHPASLSSQENLSPKGRRLRRVTPPKPVKPYWEVLLKVLRFFSILVGSFLGLFTLLVLITLFVAPPETSTKIISVVIIACLGYVSYRLCSYKPGGRRTVKNK